MSTEPPNVVASLHQAGELLDRRRVGQARRVLETALQENPDHPDLLFEAARADAIEGDHVSARQTLGEVLQRAPEHQNARLLLLAVLTDDGELVEAEQVALSLLHQFPQSPPLYASYARVMLRALHLGKARALVNEALRLDPDDDSALRMQALCDVIDLPRGTDSAALGKLIAQNPDDVHTLAMVVTALAHERRNREALHGARELLRAQPDNRELVTFVRELRAQTHWSLWPLLPLQRFGWNGVIVLWIGGIALVEVLRRVAPDYATPASFFIFGYCIYSWVWPPLLRRLLLRDRDPR